MIKNATVTSFSIQISTRRDVSRRPGEADEEIAEESSCLVMQSSMRRLKPSLNDSRQMEVRAKRHSRLSRKTQYNIGTAGEAAHFYKFTGKQTQNWRKLDKNLHDYLVNLIESSVKLVASKPTLRKDEDVQSLLHSLKVRLKGKLTDLKAPVKKYGDYRHLRSNLTHLTEELQQMKEQEVLLEKAIRQEERLIEQLESTELGEELDTEPTIQIPDEKLNLPRLASSIT